MIGIDTNVLVRYLVKDDPQQSPRAAAFMRALTSDEPGYLTTVALIEAYWVLTSRYRQSRQDAANALGTLALADDVVVEHELSVLAAVAHANRGGDFADALIAHVARRAGCSRVVTFDRDAAERLSLELI